MFIAFEGIDGSGKTTTIQKLKEHLESKTNKKVHVVTASRSDCIDMGIVASKKYSYMTHFLASIFALRATYEKQVLPLLGDTNNIVLCDRYISSAFAYSAIEKLGEGSINIEAKNDCFIEFSILAKQAQVHKPDYVILLDTDPEVARDRMKLRGGELSYVDKKPEEYHIKISLLLYWSKYYIIPPALKADDYFLSYDNNSVDADRAKFLQFFDDNFRGVLCYV